MSENMLTLADIRRELENKYGPFKFMGEGGDVYELTAAMRLSKEVRKHVQSLLDTLGNEDGVQDEDGLVAALEEVFIAICNDGKGYSLVRELKGDLALLMDLLQRWQEKTQPGEASSSQN